MDDAIAHFSIAMAIPPVFLFHILPGSNFDGGFPKNIPKKKQVTSVRVCVGCVCEKKAAFQPCLMLAFCSVARTQGKAKGRRKGQQHGGQRGPGVWVCRF